VSPVRIVDLIEAKRDGATHSRADLEALVDGYVRGEVPDYQLAAWLMAVCWRGMTSDEVATLTQVMAASGQHDRVLTAACCQPLSTLSLHRQHRLQRRLRAGPDQYLELPGLDLPFHVLIDQP